MEASTDGGQTWAEAELHRPVAPYAWTQWALAWRPPKTGNYAIMCRATDGDGRLQGAAPRPPHPSGASGLHRIELRAT